VHAFSCLNPNQVARFSLVWTESDEAYGYDLDPTGMQTDFHSHASRDRFGNWLTGKGLRKSGALGESFCQRSVASGLSVVNPLALANRDQSTHHEVD